MTGWFKGAKAHWKLAAALAFSAASSLGSVACADRADVLLPEGEPLLEKREAQALAFGDPTQECVKCHEDHVNEWKVSNHAYAAKDPVFAAMIDAGQAATNGKLGQFCVQCHTPPGMASGQTAVTQDAETGKFTQDLSNLGPIAQQGVSCDVCHSITDVVEPKNARAVLTPNGVRRATIKDPVETSAHGSEYSELHKSSDVCGMCHAVVNPKGALVEETFGEWEKSNAAKEGKTCQTCHMPAKTGYAAKDGPQREIHTHKFIGVDVSLLPPSEFPGYYEVREEAAKLLQTAAKMNAVISDDRNQLSVTLQNQAGHALPSGATAERQMWLDIVIRNDAGQVVFSTGQLDENGDLEDGVEGHSTNPGGDPNLVYYGQAMLKIDGFADMNDAQKASARSNIDKSCLSMAQGVVSEGMGASVVTFPWEADWQCNYLLQPDASATHDFDLSELPAGGYKVSVALKFRTFPNYFLRKLESNGLDPEVKNRVPIVTMATQELFLERLFRLPVAIYELVAGP